MKPIRLGVVGYGVSAACGRGAALFKQAVEGFEDVIPAAVCDLAPEARALAARNHPGIATYEHYDEMLERSGIEAVLVGTPATCHAAFAVKALQANIHVLSEIPSVYAMEEADMLWDAHLKSTALYMTGSNTNFRGYIDAAVDLQKRGLLGKPIYMESEYIHDVRNLLDKTPWRKTYLPIRYCTHSLGPMLRLIDEDLKWVTCFDTGSHLNKAPDEHDFMVALFRTASNVVVRFVASFINEAGSHIWQYRVFTDKGMFERTCGQDTAMGCDPADRPRTLFYSKDLPLTTCRVDLPVGDMPPAHANNPKAQGHGGIDFAMLDAFFKAIREGLPSPISLKDGLRMSLPGLFAAESARQGGALVRIAYPWSR